MAQAVVAATQPAGAEHPHAHGHATNTGVSNAKLGIWIFLSSEAFFFGAFITTYFLYRGRDATFNKGPKPSDLFNIPFTSVTSFILLMSSLTMVLALAAIQRGDHRQLRIWLLATALFGLTFVGGQVFEFTEFYREGLHLVDEHVRYDVLRAHRPARRARHDGHHLVADLVGPLDAGPPRPGAFRGGRDQRPVLALRRHRLDLHLHRGVPHPADVRDHMERGHTDRAGILSDQDPDVTEEAGGLVPAGSTAVLVAGEDDYLPDTPGAHQHPGPRQYVIIAIVLVVITAIEVAVSYLDGDVNSNLLIAMLAVAASIKFFLVAAWYMHMKMDSPFFRRVFVTGLVGATVVYCIALATFANTVLAS